MIYAKLMHNCILHNGDYIFKLGKFIDKNLNFINESYLVLFED